MTLQHMFANRLRAFQALLATTAVVSSLGSPLVMASTLVLESRIPLAGTQGRLDHLAVDVEGRRLFLAALGADAAEVIDLKAGSRAVRLDGLHEPQGVVYLAGSRQLLVANGASGNVESYVQDRRAASVGGLPDADNIRFDAQAGRVYVGFASALAVLDPVAMRVVERHRLPGHPEAFALATAGPEIYVNVPTAGKVVVVDRRTGKTTATWDVAPATRNFPMALDEPNHRLVVATRQPPTLQVYDTATGRRLSELPLCGDADDLFLDASRRQLYAVCGEGQVAIARQRDADHYEVVDRITTQPGARTGLYVPSFDRLYVAAPAREGRPAEVLVYRIE
jgi:DNA-binding beta-propeller fold protein YncE